MPLFGECSDKKLGNFSLFATRRNDELLIRSCWDKKPGSQMGSLFYLPLDSKVTVDLSYRTRELVIECFNPENNMVDSGGKVVDGIVKSFIAPFTSDAVLNIFASNKSLQAP
jgi:hypothetical protein